MRRNSSASEGLLKSSFSSTNKRMLVPAHKIANKAGVGEVEETEPYFGTLDLIS